MNEERMINLEIKFAHQDDFISQLNKIVSTQQMTIERLEKDVMELKRNLNVTNSVDGNRSLSDDKPPHY
jgi:SlyX protein